MVYVSHDGLHKRFFSLPAIVALLFLACDRGGVPREIMDMAWQAHVQMLTVSVQAGEIDPHGMEKEGLDAAFLIVPVEEGGHAPESCAGA